MHLYLGDVCMTRLSQGWGESWPCYHAQPDALNPCWILGWLSAHNIHYVATWWLLVKYWVAPCNVLVLEGSDFSTPILQLGMSRQKFWVRKDSLGWMHNSHMFTNFAQIIHVTTRMAILEWKKIPRNKTPLVLCFASFEFRGLYLLIGRMY